jgi:hypothetical protein
MLFNAYMRYSLIVRAPKLTHKDFRVQLVRYLIRGEDVVTGPEQLPNAFLPTWTRAQELRHVLQPGRGEGAGEDPGGMRDLKEAPAVLGAMAYQVGPDDSENPLRDPLFAHHAGRVLSVVRTTPLFFELTPIFR